MSLRPVPAIQAALSAGDLSLARRLLDRFASEIAPWARQALAFRTEFLAQDLDKALAVAEEGVERFPEQAKAWLYLANIRLAMARPADALTAAQDGLERFPSNVALLEAAAKAATKSRRPLDALRHRARLAELGWEPARQHALTAGVYAALYRGDDALIHYEKAITAGADREALTQGMARAAEAAKRLELARALWSHVGRSDTDQAQAGLARIARLERLAARQALRSVAVDDLAGLDKAGAISTPRGDLTVWRRPQSKVLILVFGGLHSMMDLAPPAVPAALQHGKGPNLIAFRDVNRLLMLKGAASLAEDHAGTVAALRDLADSWEIERIYVLGYSAGGLAALRYAVDLRAWATLLLSPSLAISENAPSLLLADLLERGEDCYIDARSYLEAAAGGLAVQVAYGADNAADAWQARRIEGLAGVAMTPLDGVSTHSLILTDHHDRLLETLLSDEPGAVSSAID